jgi:hypothetical protein
MTLTSHRTEDLRSSLDPSSLHFSTKLQQLALSFSISLQSCTEHLQYTSDHTDPATSTKPLAIHHIDVLLPPLLTLPKYLFIDYKMGLSVGKPMGRHPFPFTSTQNPKRDPKIGLASLICFALRSIFGKLSQSQKWSNMTKYSSKLGQGPTTHSGFS